MRRKNNLITKRRRMKTKDKLMGEVHRRKQKWRLKEKNFKKFYGH